MANYSTIKSAILAVIKQNGNNEITGPVLQQTLLSLINDTVSVGYLYKGVAVLTPTATNPGTPDQKVFYIAYQPGIYGNFGGLAVESGEVAILKGTGSSWSKDSTGAASAASITQISQEVVQNGVIQLEYIGQTKTAGLPLMNVRDYGVDTNNPNEIFQKTGATTYITIPLNKNGIFRYQGIDFIYDEDNIRLLLHPRYASEVVDVIAIQGSRPSTLQDGQFYLNNSLNRLVASVAGISLSTPLTTSGLYRMNGGYYYFDGTQIRSVYEPATDKSLINLKDIGSNIELQENEAYLALSNGYVRKKIGGVVVDIAPYDGMTVFYKGIVLVYSTSEGIWYPHITADKQVMCGLNTQFRWRISSNKLTPVMATSAASDWSATILQKVKRGDKIAVLGVASETNPVAILTDLNYNVILTKISTTGGVPFLISVEEDGYFVSNFTSLNPHYCYLSSAVDEIDFVGVFMSNPLTYYSVPFARNDIYYNYSTQHFIINDGSQSVDITTFINSLGSFLKLRNKDYLYIYRNGRFVIEEPPKHNFTISDIHFVAPAIVAGYKDGISLIGTQFADSLYAKFDYLANRFPDYLTKADAVTLANSLGANLSYPAYANLGGVASGGYLATPTYRTYIYKLTAPDSVAMNQNFYNKKTRVFIVGGNHPYEIAAPINLYLLARDILESLGNLTRNIYEVLANLEIYILPCLNGYGIYHNQDGYPRINANGVNINRNFPTVRWSSGEQGQNYGGPSGGSEFETQLVMALTNGLLPDICIDAHNFDKAERQFFATFGLLSLSIERTEYNFYLEVSRRLKNEYPSYFGANFGYLSEMASTLSECSAGSTTDWWSAEAHVAKAMTFEISRCINFENGEPNMSDWLDDYGNTLFSTNEFALKLMLALLANQKLLTQNNIKK